MNIIDDLLRQIRDLERQVRALQRTETSLASLSAVAYSGAPTAGAVAYWTGAGTVAGGSVYYNAGTLLVGASSPGVTGSKIYGETDGSFMSLSLASWRTSASGARNTFGGYGASGSKASPGTLTTGQPVLAFRAFAYDGVDYEQIGYIEFQADGAHASDDTPGRIVIYTTPDGSDTPAQVAMFDSSQNMIVGTSGVTPAAKLHVLQSTLGNEVLRLTSTATNDDPRESVYQARAATTDATVTTLWSMAVPASTTVGIEAWIVARRTGGSSGTAEDGAFYQRISAVKNVTGTATVLAGADTAPPTYEDQAGWNATIDVSGGDVRVRVTGAANNNVTWHATIRAWQVSS